MDKPLSLDLFQKYYHYNHSGDYYFSGHTHDTWEINVVTKGSLGVTYDDQVITLQENMLIICENDVFHRNRVLTPEGAELFVFHFYADGIPHQKDAKVYELDEKNLVLVQLIAEEAEKKAERIENNSLHTSNLNYQSTRLLEILLMRLIEHENASVSETHPDEKIYKSAIRFMNDNISQTLTIDDIAIHCHISPSKLKAIFSEFAGSGVISRFSQMKIDIAKQLLKEGMPISEVSERLGYSSQAYMSLCFKKQTGLSPLAFKKLTTLKNQV